MEINEKKLREKTDRIQNKMMQYTYLCNFCTKQNDCPYLDRIKKSSEILKEEATNAESKIVEVLGENPYKKSYYRRRNVVGSIYYCDRYDGAIAKSDDFYREIVCLCGSTKFQKEFEAEQKRLTLEGKIVMSVGFFSHDEENSLAWEENGTKSMLDIIHIEKMMLSDRIHVINKDGYIGKSTQNQINIATIWDIPITYMEPINDEEEHSKHASN